MKTGYIILHLVLVVLFVFPLTDVYGDLIGITELQPMNEARTLFGAAKGSDGKIYAFGGVRADGYGFSGVEYYDSNTDSWTNLQSMPGSKGWHRAVTAPDGKIYLFGGSSNSYPSKEVWAYDTSTDTWDTSIAQMPVEERDTVAVLGNDGIIYLFGGYWNYSTVQAFNPSTKTWEMKSSMPTGRWAAAGALGPDGKIYVVGGGCPGQPDWCVYDTLEVYDPSTDSWETKSSMPTARNYLGAAFGGDGKLYAIGGEVYGAGRTGIVYDVIEAYDPLTDTWETAGNLPVGLTLLSGSVLSDDFGNIYSLGGNTLTETTNLNLYLLISVPVITVEIDIKPGSFPNSINLKSKSKVPVAILSSQTFDATTVDRSTVVFAGASPLPIGRSPKDVNGDGLLDIVLHFKTQDLDLQPGDTEACLTGKTSSGQEFKGCDSVIVK